MEMNLLVLHIVKREIQIETTEEKITGDFVFFFFALARTQMENAHSERHMYVYCAIDTKQFAYTLFVIVVKTTQKKNPNSENVFFFFSVCHEYEMKSILPSFRFDSEKN